MGEQNYFSQIILIFREKISGLCYTVIASHVSAHFAHFLVFVGRCSFFARFAFMLLKTLEKNERRVTVGRLS